MHLQATASTLLAILAGALAFAGAFVAPSCPGRASTALAVSHGKRGFKKLSLPADQRKALLRSVNAGISVYVSPSGEVVNRTEVTDSDNDGYTAVIQAGMNGHTETVRALVALVLEQALDPGHLSSRLQQASCRYFLQISGQIRAIRTHDIPWQFLQLIANGLLQVYAQLQRHHAQTMILLACILRLFPALEMKNPTLTLFLKAFSHTPQNKS